MTTAFLYLLTIGCFIIIAALVMYGFTDKKELKELQKEAYEEMERRDLELQRTIAREKEANEKKKELRKGTDTDKFDSSLDIMHKYANRQD